jgi:hypothetical protein
LELELLAKNARYIGLKLKLKLKEKEPLDLALEKIDKT